MEKASEIRVMLLEDNGDWTFTCLDYLVYAQSDNRDDALRVFCSEVEGLFGRVPKKKVDPPKRLVDMFDSEEVVQSPERVEKVFHPEKVVFKHRKYRELPSDVRVILIVEDGEEGEEDYWTAHCLDYMIFAQGRSQKLVIEALTVMVKAYIDHRMHESQFREFFPGSKPFQESDRCTPPPRLVDMFDSGEDVTNSSMQLTYFFHPMKVKLRRFQVHYRVVQNEAHRLERLSASPVHLTPAPRRSNQCVSF